jgi:hypothetical protein
MLAQLAGTGLAVRRVGVDGRGQAASELRRLVASVCPAIEFDLSRLSAAEVGCWLSHLTAWTDFLRNSRRCCCVVIEDDLVLADGFAEAVHTLARQERYDTLFLGTSSKNLSARRGQRIGGIAVREPVGSIYNTWGYVLHRRFIESLLARRPLGIDVPIDHVLGGRRPLIPAAIAVVVPGLVREADWLASKSQIDASALRVDRWALVQDLRRRLLRSRAGDLYSAMFRWR